MLNPWQYAFVGLLSFGTLIAQPTTPSSSRKASEPARISVPSDSVRVAWMNHYTSGGASSNDAAIDVATDAAGCIYVTGKCETPDVGIDYLTIKYSTGGQELWRARYDGDAHGDDIPVALRVDPAGNVYVTGMSAAFNVVQVYDCISRYDYATVKYNSAGLQQWVARYNGPANRTDVPSAMFLGADGKVYVAGQSDADSASLIGVHLDLETVCYGPEGNQAWAVRYPATSTSSNEPPGIALDDSGNVYVATVTQGYDSLYRSYSQFTTLRYSPQGEQQWIASIPVGSGGVAGIGGIAAVRADGVYLTGFAHEIPERSFSLLAKYNFGGELIWFRMVGDSTDYDTRYRPHALSVDDQGNIVLAGVRGSYQGSPEEGDVLFAAKFSPQGTRLWMTFFSISPSNPFVFAGMSMSTSGDLYLSASVMQLYSMPYRWKGIASWKCNASGNIQWAQTYDANQQTATMASAVTGDHQGNAVVVGSRGTDNQMDFITLKYQPTGTLQWSSQATGTGHSCESVVAATSDAAGDLYVLESSTTRGVYSDFVTLKYDPNGQQLWAARYSSPSNIRYNYPQAIAAEGAGNVYVAGFNSYNETYCCVKYNPQGRQLWVRSFQGYNDGRHNEPARLFLDQSGNVYVGGSNGATKYSPVGEVVWEFRNPVSSMAVDRHGNAYFMNWQITRRDPAGSDTVIFNGSGNDMAVDDSGNVYLTMSGTGPPYSPGTVKMGPSGTVEWSTDLWADRIELDRFGNVFLANPDAFYGYVFAKLNNQGILQYHIVADWDGSLGASVDDEGNIYAFGYGHDWPQPGVKVVKYGADSTVAWQTEFRDVEAIIEAPHAVAADPFGNLYVIGNAEQMDLSTKLTVTKLEQVTAGVKPEQPLLSTVFALEQNYPNPFNPTTEVGFRIGEVGLVSLKVYDLLGREVATLVDEVMKPGAYAVRFDGSRLASGVYFYRLQAGQFSQTRRLMLLK